MFFIFINIYFITAGYPRRSGPGPIVDLETFVDPELIVDLETFVDPELIVGLEIVVDPERVVADPGFAAGPGFADLVAAENQSHPETVELGCRRLVLGLLLILKDLRLEHRLALEHQLVPGRYW